MNNLVTSTGFAYLPGTRVLCRGEEWVIQQQIVPDKLLLEAREGSRTLVVKSYEVAPPDPVETAKPISAIPDDDNEIAKRRYEFIEPILGAARKERGRLAKAAAALADVSVQTIYSWKRKFEAFGTVSSLAPRRKGSQRGQRRLDPKVEAIIMDVIEREYLTKQRKSVKTVYTYICIACADAGIAKPPSLDTVRRRIRALPKKEVTAKRHGMKAARDKFDAAAGKFPNGEFPLQTVQIDHTVLDIVLVNREDREPTTRPTLTIAIDVFSGMLIGLHLSFEPPSVASVGMCLYRTVMHKEPYLKELGVEGDWPVWGRPVALHVDNAKEFQAKSLRDGCAEYGIDLKYRPVKRPEFGGHVERAFRSLNSLIHELPGTTKSNVQDRGNYKSEKEARLTIDELEKLLVDHIVNVFNRNPRKEDSATPLSRWEAGIRKTGQFAPIVNSKKFFIDFLPQETRTVQRDGIHWSYIQYFHPDLKNWFDSGREFKVKRDPRDISKIYFLDPKLGEYVTIECADSRIPPVSLAEHKAAVNALKARNEPLTQSRQAEELRRRQEALDQAQKKKRSKKARRKADQEKRNRRELAEVHGLDAPEPKSSLKVIDGGREPNDEKSEKPEKRKFKLRPRDGQKRYEDW